jgi:REP element-mobilizing transposase RayT
MRFELYSGKLYGHVHAQSSELSLMTRSLPIIAYHIVFGAYGFWLPNDPRGSWSNYVWADRLRRFGDVRPPWAKHKLTTDVARQRTLMRQELRYPAVRLSGRQALAVGNGFADVGLRLGLVFFAAAIMPDHIHLVVARIDMHAETLTGHLKRAAARRLRSDDLHPLGTFTDARGRLPSPWEVGGWKGFLHAPDEIEAAVLYVNGNPIEAGLSAQRWSWVSPIDPSIL